MSDACLTVTDRLHFQLSGRRLRDRRDERRAGVEPQARPQDPRLPGEPRRGDCSMRRTKIITVIIEMSPITGDLPEVDARRDRSRTDVVARRVLAVVHLRLHDHVLALLGLRHPRVGPRLPEPGMDLNFLARFSKFL